MNFRTGKCVGVPVLVLLAAYIFFAPAALACAISPPEISTHHRDLVRESEKIALARVVGSSEFNSDAILVDHENLDTTDDILAIFETIEVLRGDVPDRFKLGGGRLIKDETDAVRDLNAHGNIGFWNRKTARTRNFHGVDCRMQPGFVLGRIYLIFLDKPDVRAFEEIRTKNDLWLLAVRRLLKDPEAQSGLSMDPGEWLSLATGIFIGSTVSCDGPTLWVDEVLKGRFPSFLGFNLWWRYRDDNPERSWKAGKCSDDGDYLVMTYYGEESRLPNGESIVAPVTNGRVDLRAALADSEIVVRGDSNPAVGDIRTLIAARNLP